LNELRLKLSDDRRCEIETETKPNCFDFVFKFNNLNDNENDDWTLLRPIFGGHPSTFRSSEIVKLKCAATDIVVQRFVSVSRFMS